MKVPVLSSFLLALGFVSHATAIERPKSLDTQSASAINAPRALVQTEESAEAVPVAAPWLGVFGESPDATLRQHLALESGVVLRYVAADSPAAAAGLQTHDILLEFAGIKIGSQEALRKAVAEFEPGETVSVSVVSKGKTMEKRVVLGERPADLNVGRIQRRAGIPHGGLNLEDFPELKEHLGEVGRLFPQGRDGQNFGGDFQAQMDLEERLRQIEQLPGVELNVEDLFKDGRDGENSFRLGFKSSSSVRLMDEEGSVEMKVTDGEKDVVVRDLEGEVVFEGPWTTEDDRNLVPPEVASRIEKLNLDEQANGIHLRFRQDSEPEADDVPK